MGSYYSANSISHTLALWSGMVFYVYCAPLPSSHSYIDFSLLILLKSIGLFVVWDCYRDIAPLTLCVLNPGSNTVKLIPWAP